MTSPPEEEKPRIDILIDALFQSLPAASQNDIRLAMQRVLGERLSSSEVARAIYVLRRNSEHYGWTIPHAGEYSANRYFIALAEKNGEYSMDPDKRDSLDSGLRTSIARVFRQSSNQHAALQLSLVNETHRTRRELISDLAADLAYVSRKAGVLLRNIEQQRAA